MNRQLSAAFAFLAASVLLNGCGRHQEYVSPYPNYYAGEYYSDGAAYWDEAGQESYVSTVSAEDGYETGYSDSYYNSYPSSYSDTEQGQYENDGTYYWGGDQGAYVSTQPAEEVYEDASTYDGAYWNSSASVVTVPAYSSGSSFSAPSTYVPSASRSYSSSSNSFFRVPSPVSAEYCRAFLAYSEQQERLRRAAGGR